MSVATLAPAIEDDDQHLVLHGVEWEQYVTINDAFPDRRGLRMIYIDGSLTFLTLSPRHERFEDSLDTIIKAVALGCGIEMEIAGSATFRLVEEKVGVEGDRTYYFGAHAEFMSDQLDIDLTRQPPPDLAIEVEVTHPADKAIATYARIRVPEVWRFDARHWTLTFLILGEDGAYQPATTSRCLPLLKPEDIVGQLRLRKEIGLFSRWYPQLNEWVRTTILPRMVQD